MNLEKLKPWNWFKHEDHGDVQIPVTKSQARSEMPSQVGAPDPSPYMPGSLLQVHLQMNRLLNDVSRMFAQLTSSTGFRDQSWLTPKTGEQSLGLGQFLGNSLSGFLPPRLDISGDADAYEVTLDLPGFTQEDVDIELSGSLLTIRGQAEDSQARHYYRVERSLGTFLRTLSLPEDASGEEITASMRHGVLTVRIPRKPAVSEKMRRITIAP